MVTDSDDSSATPTDNWSYPSPEATRVALEEEKKRLSDQNKTLEAYNELLVAEIKRALQICVVLRESKN